MSQLANYARRIRTQPISKTAAILLKPKKLFFHASRLFLGGAGQLQNFYRDSDRETDIRFCMEVLGCGRQDVENAFLEIEDDKPFIDVLASRYRERRNRSMNLGRFKCWFTIMRLVRPEVVVETGVHDGLSSALILRALQKNGTGRLVSIDLPSVDLPSGVAAPGWIVPDELRSLWTLHLGDARKLLPEVLERVGKINVFIHDSDHTRAHQEFEIATAKQFLSRPGMILCDDPHRELISSLASAWSARTTGYFYKRGYSRGSDRPIEVKDVPDWALEDGSDKGLAAIVFDETAADARSRLPGSVNSAA